MPYNGPPPRAYRTAILPQGYRFFNRAGGACRRCEDMPAHATYCRNCGWALVRVKPPLPAAPAPPPVDLLVAPPRRRWWHFWRWRANSDHTRVVCTTEGEYTAVLWSGDRLGDAQTRRLIDEACLRLEHSVTLTGFNTHVVGRRQFYEQADFRLLSANLPGADDDEL